MNFYCVVINSSNDLLKMQSKQTKQNAYRIWKDFDSHSSLIRSINIESPNRRPNAAKQDRRRKICCLIYQQCTHKSSITSFNYYHIILCVCVYDSTDVFFCYFFFSLFSSYFVSISHFIQLSKHIILSDKMRKRTEKKQHLRK